MTTKVKQIETYKDSQGEHLVCRGKLVLIKNELFDLDICKQRVLIDNDLFSPIIISETEEIEEKDNLLIKSNLYKEGVIRYATKHYGKCVYNFDNKKYVWTYSGETYQQFIINEEAFKILVLPEQFSPKHLQAIIDGKLKDGDEVLVECDDKWITVAHSLDVEMFIKLTKDNHIKLFPVKKEEYIQKVGRVDRIQEESWNDIMNRFSKNSDKEFIFDQLTKYYHPPKRK